jgi:hypothetical protein
MLIFIYTVNRLFLCIFGFFWGMGGGEMESHYVAQTCGPPASATE